VKLIIKISLFFLFVFALGSCTKYAPLEKKNTPLTTQEEKSYNQTPVGDDVMITDPENEDDIVDVNITITDPENEDDIEE
jgi:hypothetical protein